MPILLNINVYKLREKNYLRVDSRADTFVLLSESENTEVV